MKFIDWQNKKVTVMGLGVNGGGVGTVRFFSQIGARVIVTDLKDTEQLATALEKIKNLKNIEYVLGQHRTEDFTRVDLVVKNPAVSWNNKYIDLALKNKVPVKTDASLFFQFCSLPAIGVTGTKGKTTTTSLIFEIMKNGAKHPLQVGVGQVSVLDKALEVSGHDWVVAELSSWRLASLGHDRFSPHIAVFLNFFPDHLNYYSNLESYLQDKKQIFIHQKPGDCLVINFDDPILQGVASEAPGKIFWFSLKTVPLGNAVYIEDGWINLRYEEKTEKIMPVEEVKLLGENNLSNILSAVATGYVAGVSIKEIRKTIGDFQGLPDRLEVVREINGVKYFNDTTATNPGSALSSLKSIKLPIVLIAGGSDKNLNFHDLALYISEHIDKAGFLEGSATQKILAELGEIKKERVYPVFSSLQEAVNWAKDEARGGEAVVLSPGAASFGMFQNEFDRGEQFRALVRKLT